MKTFDGVVLGPVAPHSFTLCTGYECSGSRFLRFIPSEWVPESVWIWLRRQASLSELESPSSRPCSVTDVAEISQRIIAVFWFLNLNLFIYDFTHILNVKAVGYYLCDGEECSQLTSHNIKSQKQSFEFVLNARYFKKSICWNSPTSLSSTTEIDNGYFQRFQVDFLLCPE